MAARVDPNRGPIPAEAKAGGGFQSVVAGGGSPAPAPGQRTITGTGFGVGPNVVLFDRMDGGHLETLSPTRVADVGAWTNSFADPGTAPKLYADRGRTWFSQRDPAFIDELSGQYKTGMFLDFPATAEFRFSQRRWVPTDKHFPGAEEPGVFPTVSPTSVWKPTWMAGSDGTQLTGFGNDDGQADVVFDSHVSTGSISTSGNSTIPKSQDVGSSSGTIFTDFSFTAPTFTTWYQGGVESAEGVEDQTLDSLLITDIAQQRKFTQLAAPFAVNAGIWSTMTKAYSGMNFGGWVGNQSDRAQNDLPLLADAYLAVGPNSQACILTSNAATLLASTEAYIIPPDRDGSGNPVWTDTEIKYTPVSYEELGFTHLILADGTLLENVAVS